MECLRDDFKHGAVLGGRYQTISPLNHGSFGMVFMARDLRTNDDVAIKCLTKRAAANELGLDFAIDDKSEELALHSRLTAHPNIVNLLDSFETDAHIYIVLEFCDHGDLYEAIRNGAGPLETEHVRRFMLELVDAVAYIHSKGVYHRDIKPENIFLSQNGAMKLGDFGLATTERWTYETTVGSDRYMSPEQYDSAGAGYSPAQADIWAIGICLLNILFSRNPFTAPTESDPLFLDFSRDKQSLFDVFPSMSQDTYEVIVECMNMDPSKRSLIGARNALRRVVSFTTEDEILDDFCCTERRTIASANREPLRTPSIQSPQVDNGSFPWAKALQASPAKPIRQLSVIPDNESYSEDLFSKSEATTDWFSGSAETPSISSVMESNLAASMMSLNINRSKMPAKAISKVSPMAGSLPINMLKPRQSAMSLVFGRKETVSKSWSDMWDEDTEEEERSREFQTRQEMNARTWSQESKVDDENTPRQSLSPVVKSAAMHGPVEGVLSIDSTLSNNIDDDLVADGFFFQEALPAKVEPPQTSPRYSPPPKRGGVDKWAALGERRRAYTGGSPTAKSPGVAPPPSRPAGSNNSGHSSSLGQGFADLYGHSQHNAYSFLNTQHHATNNNNNQATSPHHHSNNGKWNNINNKDRAKECPWNKSRDRDWNHRTMSNWRKENRHAFGDMEWVGGWQESHL